MAGPERATGMAVIALLAALPLLVDAKYKPKLVQPKPATEQLYQGAAEGDVQKVLWAMSSHPDIHWVNPKSKKTAMLAAVAGNHDEVIPYLFATGADCEAPGHDGSLPLHLAASLGHLKPLKVLLNHGCTTDKKDEDGKTALAFAVVKERVEVVKELLKRGARVKALDFSPSSVDNAEIRELLGGNIAEPYQEL